MSGPSTSPEPSETAQFEAIGRYPDGSTRDLSNWAEWASSNASVAVVSSSGLVAAMAPGAAIVSATYGGVAGSRQIEVVPTGAGRRGNAAGSTSGAGAWARPGTSADAGPVPEAAPSAYGGATGSGDAGVPGSSRSRREYTGRELLLGLGEAIWADVTLATEPARERAATLHLGRAMMYSIWTTWGLVLLVAGVFGLLRGRRGLLTWVALPVGVPVGLVGPAVSRLGGGLFEIAQVLTLLMCLTLAIPAISIGAFKAGSREFRTSFRIYVGICGLFLCVLVWAVWSLQRNPPLG